MRAAEARCRSRTQSLTAIVIAVTPAERRSNVRGAFSPVASALARIRGRHVTLIDDVLTTGATAGEAAQALERAGAAGVSLFTFARALPDRRRVRSGGG